MVGTAPGGELGEGLLDGRHALVGGRRAQERTGLLGLPAAFLDHVEPDDPDPGGDQQADRKLPDEAEPDHAGGVAQLRLGAPHAVHGDRPDGGERGVLGRNALGTAAHRLTGTQLYSACRAYSLPAAATSCPVRNSSAPRPTSATTPHSE